MAPWWCTRRTCRWHRLQAAVDGAAWTEHRFLTAEALAQREAARARADADAWRWPSDQKAAAAAVLAGAPPSKPSKEVRFSEPIVAAASTPEVTAPATLSAGEESVVAEAEVPAADAPSPPQPVTLMSDLVFALE